MLDQRRVATQPDEKREQLFTERYQSLLAWALRLTNQQREAAEDLVQDAFVQFMLGRTRLEEIENIDGYLRRMLRYMHVSKLNRSAQHLQETALSVADYDTCRLSWSAIEPPRRMQASEELYQICSYACSRKESSKAGCVLILRFFFDYFPSEIARVLNGSRHSVDELQRFARREAKLFMNKPRRLRFVDPKQASERQRIKYLGSEGDLMSGLRQMIFDSCHGECSARQVLEEIYTTGNADALTTTALAHIVSCPGCLDTVNSLLGLPLLSERYQIKTNERPPDDDGGTSGGGSGNLPATFGHKLRETQEHKPQELRIAVNGFVVSSLKVSSDLSELDLNLTADDPVEFVEVSSEQGVQLLFFSIDPAGPPAEQWAFIELSDGRLLEACFQNENAPTLRVVYEDALPEEALEAETPSANNLSSPLFIVPEPQRLTQSAIVNLRSWIRWFVGRLQYFVRRRFVAAETTAQSPDALVQSMDDGFSDTPFRTLLSQTTRPDRRHSWRGLSLLVLLISAVMIVGFLVFKARLSPLTATALLETACVAEVSAQQTPDKVRHRSIRLEERRSAEGAIVAQRKIEIWENRASGNRAQRLYDDTNLIAGAWQKPDGSRTVYHHGSKPQPQPALATPDNLLLNLEDVWQLEPSAQTFRTLIAEPAVASVEERSTTYVLSYEKERTIGASRLLKATLTLSKSDLHSIEQTLLVQRGSESREYRFVEASFELLPVKAVAPAAFEIEPELTGGAGELGRPVDWAHRDLTTSRVPPSPNASTPPIAASAELEVDVAYLLNQAKADRNEQVALTRSAGGSLRVEGVVESQQRKDEILKALASVSNNPAVKIEIRTVAEATQRRAPTTPVVVQEAEETANTVAADEDLRRYFAKTDPGGPGDELIRAYSSRVVNGAYRAVFHAIELRKLINRFANVDMRTVTPDARAKWLAMLREHAGSFARENALLRREIQPVFFAGSSLRIAEDVSIQSDADLARVVERLHKLALSNSDAIRAALVISAQSSTAALKSAAFWQSMQRAENFAEAIMRYQASSN